MVGSNEQVTKTDRETSTKLTVNFQASLHGVGQLTIMFHASGAYAAGSIQQTSAGHLDGPAVDTVIAAGVDDASSNIRRSLRSREPK
jgi:hypothetical protein